MNTQDTGLSTKKMWIIAALFSIFLFEWFLFRSFVLRELAWSPYIHDDETWYLPQSYEAFESIVFHHMVPRGTVHAPHGIWFFLSSTLFYFLFGPSRLTALSVNFFYYLLSQLVVFFAALRLTKRFSWAWVALGLSLVLPGREFFATMTFFSHSFVAHSLFWIWMSLVVASNFFLDRTRALLVGLAASLVILARYYYAAFVIPIYGLTFLFFILCWFVCRNKKGNKNLTLDYKNRSVNLLLSGLVPVVLLGRFLWIIRESLYNHHVGSVSKVSYEMDWVFWGSGVKTLQEALWFYPNNALLYMSRPFLSLSFLLIVLVSIAAVLGRWKYKKTVPVSSFSGLDWKIAAFFFITALLVPYLLLTPRAVRQSQIAGCFHSSVFWLILLALIGLARWGRLDSGRGKTSAGFMLLLPAAVLLSGALFQLDLYSKHARPLSTPELRQDMTQINTLFDDVSQLCKKKDWLKPAISVDNWVWYIYGCALNLKSLHYERHGVLLDIQPRLGQSLLPVDEKTAMGGIAASDIVILGAPQKGIYPVVDDATKAKVWAVVEKEFQLLGTYQIEGSQIRVYYKDSPEVRASSSGAGHAGSRAFDGSAAPDDFWEAPGYPQWLQVKLPQKKKITGYELQSGYTAVERMPSTWHVEGSEDAIHWSVIDERNIKDAWKTDETKTFTLTRPVTYPYYRFTFLGGKDPTIVRIYEIVLKE